ncbi:hypothetical protein [Mucilaginibacter sp.]|uniref:hypothetical protein n=1 Tax=Mucilaginibacter sp. TaxID=1882438 RepID=UPI0026021B60|nr:hypothetical protein [Mucilaginibacter sp.]MDB5126607.1 hypothetical protein [Mucilaginibacter sp.]
MKKLLIAFLAFGLLAVSCKKDLPKLNVNPNTPPNTANAKKHKVTFTVSQFSQTVGDIDLKRPSALMAKKGVMATSTSALSDALAEYHYIVYDEAGSEIKRITRYANNNTMSIYHQDGKDYGNRIPGLEYVTNTAPFNVITDSLAAGNYTIVVTGSSGAIIINTDKTSFGDPIYRPIRQSSPTTNYVDLAAVYVAEGVDAIPRSVEIYFAKCNVTIGDTDATHSLTLNRIVGQLEVNLEDAIPNNVAYIQAGRSGEYKGFSFEYEVPFGETMIGDDERYADVTPNVITSADIGKTNYKLQRYILNTQVPITIVLKAYDAANNLIVRKEINNVRFYKNKRTILSGKLFNTGPAATQFTISANQAWGPDNPIIHF